MLCDRHHIQLDEWMVTFLWPFVIALGLALLATLAYYRFRKRHVDMWQTALVTVTTAFLIYPFLVVPVIRALTAWHQPLKPFDVLPILFGAIFFGLGSVAVAPALLFIYLLFGKVTKIGSTAAVLLVGSVANYIWLDQAAQSC